MDVLRAVRPRARDRGRAVLARVTRATRTRTPIGCREKHAAGYRALDAMERHLGGREWFVGDEMSLADIALYAYTHVADEGGFDLGRYPAIRAWLGRVAAEPGHVPIDA